jgi:CRISPR-associated protein Csy3
MAKRKLPSFLNFNRSISPSEGFMFGVDTRVDDHHVDIPVEVIERGIRSSISNYTNVYGKNAKDTDKNINVLKDPEQANLQKIDVAFLSQDADRLKMIFSVIFQAESLAPSACNDVEFRAALVKLTAAYGVLGGYRELAKRYAWNLINGRVLWRNRFVTELSIKVSYEDVAFVFHPANISLFSFEEQSMPADFGVLVDRIALALQNPGNTLLLTFEVSGKSALGAEVFPSQEWVPDTKKKGDKTDKSRVLSTVDRVVEGRTIRQATMHSQKIGNAIRQIDEWHGQVDEYGATAIEAYGYVQSRSEALRLPSAGGKPVFALLEDIDNVLAKVEAAGSLADLDGDIHYLVAMLIRGGVFSGGSNK